MRANATPIARFSSLENIFSPQFQQRLLEKFTSAEKLDGTDDEEE